MNKGGQDTSDYLNLGYLNLNMSSGKNYENDEEEDYQENEEPEDDQPDNQEK